MNNEKEDSIVQELKKKHAKSEIYTYISSVLIAVNPYRAIDKLYSSDVVEKYQKDPIHLLPAHIFGLANEIKKSSSIDQSVIIAGESGSGKTETSKYILKFFSGSGNQSQPMMISANVMLEAFGNSRTPENANSSRFIKVLELKLGPDSIAGTEISTFSLESSRVCSGLFDTFHIFYYLACGAPEKLKKKLELECTSFSILPRQFDEDNAQNTINFEEVDQTLITLGISERKKIDIYQKLSAILHLTNIEFTNSNDEGAEITDLTKKNLNIAANKLNVEIEELERAILFRQIEIQGTAMWIRLNIFAACRARDTIAKMLYSRIFQCVVDYINQALLKNPGKNTYTNINIIDIAGFECFTINRFEQFCINYSNEKMQQFSVQKLIRDEQNWYKSENIEVPEIIFPGNDELLDMLENKQRGIFALLDEECRKPNPQTKCFMQNVLLQYDSRSHFFKSHINDFVIRHFGQNVCYTPENFIENNAEVHSKHLCDLTEQILKQSCLAPRNFKLINDKKKTYSGTFKIELEHLISKLKQTRAYFIRCVKPNRQKEPHCFDETYVINQLQSSGMLAYNKLMQLGFPVKITINEFFQKIKPFLEPRHLAGPVKNCCLIFLLSTGFQCKDFRTGNTEIHFRPGNSEKIDLMNQMILISDNRIRDEIVLKYKKRFNRLQRTGLWIMIRLKGALIRSNRMKCEEIALETNAQIKTHEQMPKQQQNSELLSSLATEPKAKTPTKTQCEKNPKQNQMKCKEISLETNTGTKTHEQLPKHQQNPELLSSLAAEPKAKTRTKTQYEKMPKPCVRFDGMNHLPDFDREKSGFRCKLEDCGIQTTVYCTKCKVHLCFVPGLSSRTRNCFKEFHSLERNEE